MYKSMLGLFNQLHIAIKNYDLIMVERYVLIIFAFENQNKEKLKQLDPKYIQNISEIKINIMRTAIEMCDENVIDNYVIKLSLHYDYGIYECLKYGDYYPGFERSSDNYFPELKNDAYKIWKILFTNGFSNIDISHISSHFKKILSYDRYDYDEDRWATQLCGICELIEMIGVSCKNYEDNFIDMMLEAIKKVVIINEYEDESYEKFHSWVKKN